MNKRRKPVSPIYAVVVLWLLWPFILPLFQLLHYAFLITAAVILYNIVNTIAKAKADAKPQQEQ